MKTAYFKTSGLSYEYNDLKFVEKQTYLSVNNKSYLTFKKKFFLFQFIHCIVFKSIVLDISTEGGTV